MAKVMGVGVVEASEEVMVVEVGVLEEAEVDLETVALGEEQEEERCQVVPL